MSDFRLALSALVVVVAVAVVLSRYFKARGTDSERVERTRLIIVVGAAIVVAFGVFILNPFG